MHAFTDVGHNLESILPIHTLDRVGYELPALVRYPSVLYEPKLAPDRSFIYAELPYWKDTGWIECSLFTGDPFAWIEPLLL